MSAGFLARHLLVLVEVDGNFHAVDRCDNLVFSIERLSEHTQELLCDEVEKFEKLLKLSTGLQQCKGFPS